MRARARVLRLAGRLDEVTVVEVAQDGEGQDRQQGEGEGPNHTARRPTGAGGRGGGAGEGLDVQQACQLATSPFQASSFSIWIALQATFPFKLLA